MAENNKAPEVATATVESSNTVRISVKPKRVSVIPNSGVTRYRVYIDQKVVGMVKNEIDEYVERELDYIDFVGYILANELAEHIPGLSAVVSKLEEEAYNEGRTGGLDAVKLSSILNGSTIVIERSKFYAGDVYTTAKGAELAHEHDGYSTSVVGVTLGEFGKFSNRLFVAQALGTTTDEIEKYGI